VLPWHQYVLGSMMRLDSAARYAELALWAAPGRFDFGPPEPVDGALMRFGIATGLGAGKPRTGFAAFGGFQFDYGMAQRAPAYFSSGGTLGAAVEGIVYGGASYKGFMATYSLLLGQGFTLADDTDAVAHAPTQMINLYNQEGVAIGGVAAKRLDGDTILAALRAELAPEKMLERLDLRDHGLFRAGVGRYEAGTNPYLDPEPAPEPQWEVPLGVDDLASLGFRLELVPQVFPTPRFRRASAGWVYQSEKLVGGGQVGLVGRGGRYDPSAEVFAVFHPEWFKYFSLWGVPRISVSYSYNVPDPAAFFPVDHAHVVGVQYVYGPPEFGRPLVPVIRRDPGQPL
jgi:hypothetical protein